MYRKSIHSKVERSVFSSFLKAIQYGQYLPLIFQVQCRGYPDIGSDWVLYWRTDSKNQLYHNHLRLRTPHGWTILAGEFLAWRLCVTAMVHDIRPVTSENLNSLQLHLQLTANIAVQSWQWRRYAADILYPVPDTVAGEPYQVVGRHCCWLFTVHWSN